MLNKKIMSTTFVLIIDWWNNQLKSIKMSYHFVIWLFSDRIIYNRKGDKTMNVSSGECVMKKDMVIAM